MRSGPGVNPPVLFNMSLRPCPPRGPRLENRCLTTRALPASIQSGRSDDSAFESNKAIRFCFFFPSPPPSPSPSLHLNAPTAIRIRGLGRTEREHFSPHHVHGTNQTRSVHSAAPHLTGYSLPPRRPAPPHWTALFQAAGIHSAGIRREAARRGVL